MPKFKDCDRVQMPKFKDRDRVQKVGGSYQCTGTIVGVVLTMKGFERYVFEMDQPAGLLHIYGPEQLAHLPPGAVG